MVRPVLILFLLFALTSIANAQKTDSPKADAHGTVSACKEIDDNWKCVGESAEWPANEPFDVLFVNPKPVGVDFIGIVIHKQGADGKDVKFINEYQQNIGEDNRKYATVGGNFRLPAGTYSIYIITWGTRDLLYHNGNFKDYLAKTTLKVK
ncbi:MAG TPA: hypothetical protein VGO43_04335 [Pyrinomonadaceae bacterium]|jgi:hypothetical protein|nr:hypothetical protein [Pyrinomonadaceae bacterium]